MSQMSQADGQEVRAFYQVPIRDDERKRTDIFCTVCTTAFAIIMFIIACACFNNYNLKRMTYYVDGSGNVCGFDEPTVDYPLVYFTSYTDPSKRLCVKSCPKEGDKSLSCYPTPNLSCYPNSNPSYEVNIYGSQIDINRIGGICRPTDPEKADQIDQISHLDSKLTFLNVYDSIWDSMWLSAIFGILLIVLLQFVTRKIVHWVFIIGGLTFVSLGIVLMIVPEGFILFKIIGGLLLLAMGFLALYSVFKEDYRREIFICGRLFQVAAMIVKDNYFIVGLILLWLFFECGLLALISFQMLSVWSIGPFEFDPNVPFLKTSSFASNFFSFFNFIELIWGLSFLKESFNFVVGGYATEWYCYKETDKSKISVLTPFKRLLKYHWGSVAGGSFLLWLFYFFDLFFDFFFSSEQSINAEDKAFLKDIPIQPFRREKLERRGTLGFLDLIRSESFAYINLVSLPYCNASRYCEMISDDSSFYDRSQTTNRLYRLCAHATIIMMATLIAFGKNRNTGEDPSLFGVLFVAMVSLFTVTYFISFHGDLAEGILVCVFTEERLHYIEKAEQGLMTQTSEGVINRPVIEIKNLYIDDLAEAYQNTTVVQYMKAKIEARTDPNHGEVNKELAIADRF